MVRSDSAHENRICSRFGCLIVAQDPSTPSLPRRPAGLRGHRAAGRMTLAADELATTHGAVSRSMRELEETLGVRLLAGSKHRLQLTEQGRIVRATNMEMRYSAGEKRRHRRSLRLWQGWAR